MIRTEIRIGDIIKENREKKKMSQNDLAQQLYVSRQAISKWENNAALPSIENIVAISDCLDISLDELMKGDKKVMEEINKSSKFNVIAKIVFSGMGIAIFLYLLLFKICGISQSIIYWVCLFLAIIAWMVLWRNLDFKHLKKSFNKTALLALVCLLVFWMLPHVNNCITGFIDGYKEGQQDYQIQHNLK